MKARTIRETEYTWEQIEEILAAGKARETFGEDGQITVQVEGIGTALLNILDYDKDKAADPDMCLWGVENFMRREDTFSFFWHKKDKNF